MDNLWITNQNKMELWKEQIHRSQYLKDYYKGREGNHPVFKKTKPISEQCFRCGVMKNLKKLTNKIGSLRVEYYLCPECYAKRGTNKKMAENR